MDKSELSMPLIFDLFLLTQDFCFRLVKETCSCHLTFFQHCRKQSQAVYFNQSEVMRKEDDYVETRPAVANKNKEKPCRKISLLYMYMAHSFYHKNTHTELVHI